MNGRTNVTLLGNLTRDIELRTTGTGDSVCSFSVAVNKTWKDKNGEKQEKVSFIDCVAWSGTATFLSKYAQKGQLVYLEGELDQNRFKDKDGNNRSKVEVIVRAAEILSRSEPTESRDVEPTAEEVDRPISLEDIPFS